ncbi:MAG: prepilin-type N-terminal cleavage/methylation domain-containing protein [Candidatus Paceibacterota bacterium]|jgi:type II secretory pathway pseudopilin PulG
MILMFLFTKKSKNYRAFSLIESLVAISILMLGILSAFILVIRTLANTPHIQSRLIASNLAQEGIELIRQIRDTNFIGSENDFRANLENGEYQIDIENRELEQFNQDDFLKFDNDKKMYVYSSGENLPYFFKRKIILSSVGEKTNVFRVNVIVT